MPLINTGALVESSDLYASKGWTTFAAALTGAAGNPSLGDTGSTGYVKAGRYIHIGEVCDYQFTLSAGTNTTGVGSGIYRVSVPVAYDPTGLGGGSIRKGVGSAVLQGTTGIYRAATVAFAATTLLQFVIGSAAGNVVTDSNPVANWWGDDAYISGTVRYATT